MNPREIIHEIERAASLPSGSGDRFAGYAVIGLPFSSGHVLALRRFPASSVGPGYTSVWHRNPTGQWTFYSTVIAEQGCSRYFGDEIDLNVVAPIEIEWLGPAHFRVVVDGGRMLRWDVVITESRASIAMNAASLALPRSWWQNIAVLRGMGLAAELALGAGKINLNGRTPNEQEFIANPRRIWMVDSSWATIRGVDAGSPGPLTEQARLRNFIIPQRGIFATIESYLGSANAEKLPLTVCC